MRSPLLELKKKRRERVCPSTAPSLSAEVRANGRGKMHILQLPTYTQTNPIQTMARFGTSEIVMTAEKFPIVGTYYQEPETLGETNKTAAEMDLHIWMSEWLRPLWWTYLFVGVVSLFSVCCITCTCGFCCCWAITWTNLPELL